MKSYYFIQKFFNHLYTPFTGGFAHLIFSLILFISNFSLAGKIGDGGGTGCRQLVMQAANDVAMVIDEKIEIFDGQLTGKKFLSMIDTNDIIPVPDNHEHYSIEYTQNKIQVQCQSLEHEDIEMVKSLITKAVFKKISELQKIDFSPFTEFMGLLNVPQYLNPEQDSVNIAKAKGFNQITNACSLHIPLGQGAHGDLDMDINEFTNEKGNKMTTAYYAIREAGNYYDYIAVVDLGVMKVLKTQNDITESNQLYTAKEIKKLKINKRTHTYELVFEPSIGDINESTSEDKTTIECENPLNII